MTNKGDIVKVSAIVQTCYVTYPVRLQDIAPYGKMIHKPTGGGRLKCLFRSPCSARGVVVGYSYRATGWYGYQEEDCPAHLMEDKRHRVTRVQPLDGTGRYYKPFACLEEDLEVVLDIQQAMSDATWLDMLEEQRCP